MQQEQTVCDTRTAWYDCIQYLLASSVSCVTSCDRYPVGGLGDHAARVVDQDLSAWCVLSILCG